MAFEINFDVTHDDRRVRRSEQLDTALSYQLDACVERAGLTTMVLADQDRLLVASSSTPDPKDEELAAILPLLVQGSDFAGILLGQQSPGDQVVVSEFNAAGTNLYLCAVGDYGRKTHEEVARAKVGVRRILN